MLLPFMFWSRRERNDTQVRTRSVSILSNIINHNASVMKFTSGLFVLPAPLIATLSAESMLLLWSTDHFPLSEIFGADMKKETPTYWRHKLIPRLPHHPWISVHIRSNWSWEWLTSEMWDMTAFETLMHRHIINFTFRGKYKTRLTSWTWTLLSCSRVSDFLHYLLTHGLGMTFT